MFVERWVGVFGAPRRVISDSGLELQNDEMRGLADRFQIELLGTAAKSPWSSGMCERMVGMVKEGLRKVKGERDVSRHMAMMWTVSAKNSLGMKDGYSPNQLVFGRNPNLPNLLGENTPSSLERGGEGRRGGIPKGHAKCYTSS